MNSPAAASDSFLLTPAPSEPAESSVAGLSDATSRMISRLTQGDVTDLLPYATKHLAPALISAAIGLFVIFMGYLVAKYLMRLVSRPICRRVDETLGKFVGKMVFYTIMFGVVGAVLSKLGAPLGGLAAMLAAAGFAVGLAFQGTLGNFAAGVLMLVFRPFKVGDMVTVGGVLGKVDEIDLFTTTLDTPDNRRIIVPNGSIAGHTIENLTHNAHRRVEVLVGIDYRADMNATREALQSAVDTLAANMIVGEGRGSAVILAGFGDSSVNWKVRLWVASTNYWPMTEALTYEIKTRLDAAGISIPFPQMDIHVKSIAGLIEKGQIDRIESEPITSPEQAALQSLIRPKRRAG